MENTKFGRRKEGLWTPIRAKAQDTRANPNPSEEEMGQWTPTGVEPKDDDDDDDILMWSINVQDIFCHAAFG